jgi:membrane dipeptidase
MGKTSCYLISFIFLGLTLAFSQVPKLDETKVKEVHFKAIVVDGHCDTIGIVLDNGVDLGVRNTRGHIDIPRMIEGGLDVQFFACFVSPRYMPDHCVKRTLDMIDALYREVAKYPDRIEIARNSEDVTRINKEGKIAAILAIEGGHAIEDDLATLRNFYLLGIRYMTLTWMNNNNWADASGPEQSIPNHGGLTDFGRDVIREMNRIGMIVDVSHVADSTFWDVIEVTNKPIIASHSCCYALNPHYRNLKDDQLKALAKNGGVIGINYAPSFLSNRYFIESERLGRGIRPKVEELRKRYKDQPDVMWEKIMALYRENRGKIKPVPLSALIDHIDHAVKIAGVDHVGLGSDFDGISDTPIGVEDASKLLNITRELLKRGYTEEEVRKMLGENFIRVLKENVGK